MQRSPREPEKVTSTQLVDDTTERIVLSQFGRIIRIDTKQVRAQLVLSQTERGRATVGVKHLDTEDKVASATVILPTKARKPTAKAGCCRKANQNRRSATSRSRLLFLSLNRAPILIHRLELGPARNDQLPPNR